MEIDFILRYHNLILKLTTSLYFIIDHKVPCVLTVLSAFLADFVKTRKMN